MFQEKKKNKRIIINKEANKNNFKIQNLNHFQRAILLLIILDKMINQITSTLINTQIKILINQNQLFRIIYKIKVYNNPVNNLNYKLQFNNNNRLKYLHQLSDGIVIT